MKTINYSQFWSPAFDIMDDLVFLIDSNFNLIRANKSFVKLTGQDNKRLGGKKCYELIHDAKKPHENCPCQKAFETQKPESEEFYDAHLKKWLHIRVTPIFDQNHNLIGIIHIATDTSEHKQSEEEVKKQKDFVESIINALENSFYVVNRDYTIAMANEAAKKRGVIEGGYCYELTHKRDKPCEGEHACPLQAVIHTKKSARMEHLHYDQDGNEMNVDVHGDPIFDKDGNVVQMIEYSIDITELKQMECRQRDRNHELERLNRLMVGREIKMTELKKEIAKLKTKLSKNEHNQQRIKK